MKKNINSFSKETKLEIINQQIEPIYAGIPFLFGLFVSSSNYDENNNIELTTDIKILHTFILNNTKHIIKNYPLIQAKRNTAEKNILFDKIILNNNLDKYILLKETFRINKKTFYKIIIKNSIFNELFSIFGIKEDNSLSNNIDCFANKIESVKSFIKGVYLGCATSSIKISTKPNEKTSSGYHLEFSSKNLILLREVSHILAGFNIFAKLISRKNLYILYLKDAENVCDTLTLIGATNSVLILQNEIVKREFRNKINRQTNCLSGNISKTVEASLKQLRAIDKIDKKIGLSSLPPDLEEIALLRLANPEEPLNILLKLSNSPLTKSGLNHRLRRIIAIAEKL